MIEQKSDVIEQKSDVIEQKKPEVYFLYDETYFTIFINNNKLILELELCNNSIFRGETILENYEIISNALDDNNYDFFYDFKSSKKNETNFIVYYDNKILFSIIFYKL